MSGDAVARRAGWVVLWLATAALCGLVTWFAIGYAVRQAEGDGLTPATATQTGPAPPPSTTPAATPTSTQVAARLAAQATDGGTVLTACRGERIELRAVTPRDGWAFATQRSPTVVQVTLREVGDRDGGESEHDSGGDAPGEQDSGEHRLRVIATCVGGRPSYRVE